MDMTQLILEVEHLKEKLENLTTADNDMRDKMAAMGETVAKLAPFVPLLEKTYAGEIAGTSPEAAAVMAGDVSQVQKPEEITTELTPEQQL